MSYSDGAGGRLGQFAHVPHHGALEQLEQRWLLSGAATDSVGCGCGICLAAAGKAPSEPPPTEMPAAQGAGPVVHPLNATGNTPFRPLASLPAARGKVSYLPLNAYTPFEIDLAQLKSNLANAPREFTSAARTRPVQIEMPGPTGTMQRFNVIETQVLAPQLAARFPQIKTYIARGIDDPTAVARVDTNPHTGFHAMVLSERGTWAIDNYFHNDASTFVSYYKRDIDRVVDFICHTPNADPLVGPEAMSGPENIPAGDVLRTFRVAITTTTAYNTFHGNTISSVLSAVTTSINRITGIYERDLSTRLELVANTTLLFSGIDGNGNIGTGSVSTLANNNQSFTDTRIGFNNYDVGHVYNNGSNNGVSAGGIGIVGSSAKARACSQTSPPSGDLFSVDYVAHEMGHQFNGRHNFSNCSGPGDSASIANEPGSGATIMGYAGLCGSNNLQNNSDAMFNHINYNQMYPYIRNTIASVGTTTPTGNDPPVVSAGSNYTIPTRTPYELIAVGSDPNNHALLYSWEGRDTGGSLPVNNTSGTTGPIVRTFLPVSDPVRTIPRLPSLLNNTTVTGEVLTTVARTINFRVMARDNFGGVNFSDMSVTTVNVGATGFQINTFNTPGLNLSGGTQHTLEWNVASTNLAPINAANVRITLSTDGGFTYPITLIASTPNDGSEVITLPNIDTATARIRVQPVDNIFFDVNNFNFRITPSSVNTPSAPELDPDSDSGISNTDHITNVDTPTFNGTGDPGATITIFASGNPVGSGIVNANGDWSVTTAPLSDGTYDITAVASFGSVVSDPSPAIQVTIDLTPPTITSTDFFFETGHRYDLTFSENVSDTLTLARLTLVNLTTSTTVPSGDLAFVYLSGDNVEVTFPGSPDGFLEDGNYTFTVSRFVTDVAGNALSGERTSVFFVLGGDANRDRSVDIGDFSILASRFNQPGTFSDGDFNYSGTVEIGDFAILASRFNTSLPPARIGASPASSPALGKPVTPTRFADGRAIELIEQSAQPV